MPETPKHSVRVAGIVVNDHAQVLVIQRADNGHWEPPGGVLELGESFEHGVAREVFEETGVRVSVDRLTGVYKNMTRGVVALVFRCTPGNEPARLSDEATSVRWLDPDAVTELMDPAYAVRVTDALNDGPPVTRAHDGVHLVCA
ncbi:MAG: NUDIX domain-containing protein [Pseudonocardia sp.]|nr:NUDIX domain-containing protein [Pseudonocardia sp.]